MAHESQCERAQGSGSAVAGIAELGILSMSIP